MKFSIKDIKHSPDDVRYGQVSLYYTSRLTRPGQCRIFAEVVAWLLLCCPCDWGIAGARVALMSSAQMLSLRLGHSWCTCGAYVISTNAVPAIGA